MMQEQSAGSAEVETAAPMDWRTKAYIVGGLVGIVVGIGAAYLYVNAAELEEDAPELRPGEAVGIGLAVLALLRQISGLRAEDKSKPKKR